MIEDIAEDSHRTHYFAALRMFAVLLRAAVNFSSAACCAGYRKSQCNLRVFRMFDKTGIVHRSASAEAS